MQTIAAKDLIATNQKKIDLLKHSTDGNFDRDFLPLIIRLGGWFNALPLHTQIYDEPGGAFRCCVESAYFVMRQAKDSIFTSELTSDKRRLLESQYQFAAFLAAVVSWVDEPFRHFDVKVGDAAFNATVHGDLSAFMQGQNDFQIAKKETPLPESRQRTIMMASNIIVPTLEKIAPTVQDALFSAINPERRPQNSESVLQRVVRKGLAQAEEFERKSKHLIVAPVTRDVSSAKMMQQTDEQRPETTVSATTGNTSSETVAAPAETASKSAQERFEEKQIRLPLPQSDLPKMPKQYQELLAAMAQDIRSGKKKMDDTEWLQSGLRIPKKFFANYGKSIQQCVEDLRGCGVITGNDNLNVLICATVGEMLVPRTGAA